MMGQNVRANHDEYNRVIGSDQVGATKVPRRNPNSKAALDRRLDLALVETFPASDSIAVIIS